MENNEREGGGNEIKPISKKKKMKTRAIPPVDISPRLKKANIFFIDDNCGRDALSLSFSFRSLSAKDKTTTFCSRRKYSGKGQTSSRNVAKERRSPLFFLSGALAIDALAALAPRKRETVVRSDINID